MAADDDTVSGTLLQYLQEHARKDFPEAFKEVSDLSLYTISQQDVEEEEMRLDLLFIGMVSQDRWLRSNTFKPVYAHPHNGTVRYYILQDADSPLVRVYDTIFPEAGRGPYRHGGLELFKYLAPTYGSGHPSDRARERRASADGVSFITKFAFLLRGRVDIFADESQSEVLKQLQKVCLRVQGNKLVEKGKSGRIVDLENGNARDVTANGSASVPHTALPMTPSNNTHSRAKRDAEKEQDALETGAQGPIKRIRIVRAAPTIEEFGAGHFEDSDSPTLTEKVRSHMHGLADAIFLVCKAKVESETARIKAALEAENDSLKERVREVEAQLFETRSHIRGSKKEKDMLDKIEKLEVQLVQEKRKVLDETDKYNEQTRKYRKLQEEHESLKIRNDANRHFLAAEDKQTLRYERHKSYNVV